MKRIFAILLGFVMMFCMVSCVDETETTATPQPENAEVAVQPEDMTDEAPVEIVEDKPAIDKAFEFDGLEITVGSNYEFAVVDNEYSDYNGATAVRIPITVKNISADFNSLNPFYFKVIGSQGTDVDSLDSYFEDDITWNAGDLRPEASYTRYMYIVYDGDGLYTVVFDNWDVKVYIDLNIAK